MKMEVEKARDTPKEKMFHNENSDKYVINRFDRDFLITQ